MKKAPIVNLNTNALIKELVGEYNDENQELIHLIAKNESELMKGCNTVADYSINMKSLINTYKNFKG